MNPTPRFSNFPNKTPHRSTVRSRCISVGRKFLNHKTFLMLVTAASVYGCVNLAYAAARSIPFTPGQTIDPSADSQPCGPLDANCFPISNSITSLNGIATTTQAFATSTAGTDFSITSSGSTHTFNLPTASASNRGLLSQADWSTFNAKASILDAGSFVATSTTATSTFAGGVSANAFIGNGSNITIPYTAAPIYHNVMSYQNPLASFGGDPSYSGYAIKGSYTTIASNININQYIQYVWTDGSDAVTVNVYVFNSMPSDATMASGLVYTTSISNANLPKSHNANGNTINLGSNVAITPFSSGITYLFITFGTPSTNHVSMATWAGTHTGYHNNGVFLSHGTNIYYGSSGYYQPGFQLNGLNDITKTTVNGLGSEILLNTKFETSGSPIWANWEDQSVYGTITNETTNVHSGSNAAKLTSDGTSPYAPQINPTPGGSNSVVVPGETYTWTFWTRGDGTNGGDYAVFNSVAGYIVGITSTGNNSSTYSKITVTFTAPTGCTNVYLWHFVDQVNGASAYFDDESLKQNIVTTTVVPISLSTLTGNLPAAGISFADPNGIMQSTNVNAAILEAYNHGTSTAATSSSSALVPRIVMPDTIYGVVGDELQIFVRGVVEAMNPYNLPYTFTSSIGNSYPRYFDVTPTSANLGTTSLTVTVTDLNQNVLASKTVNLVVASSTGQPATMKTILTVGDSLSGGGTWQMELARRLEGTGGTPAGYGLANIQFIGDEAMTSSTTQAYTSYGGWTWELYTGTSGATSGHILTGTFDKDKTDVNATYTDGTNSWIIEYAAGGVFKIHGSGTLSSSGTLTWVSGGTHTSNIVYTAATNEPESPFWSSASSTISFRNWSNRNGYSGIDGLYVLLGWNQWSESTSTVIAAAQTFLNAFHTDYPNSQVGLIGIEVPSVNGGLGNNYGASIHLAQYYWTLQMANNLNMAYQQLADNPTYSGWVRYIGTSSQFDSENNMSQTLVPVNTRNPATEERGTNGVHPATYGYYQIADAVFREFVQTFLPVVY